MEPYSNAEFAKRRCKFGELGLDGLSPPFALSVFEINAVGAGIL